MLLLLDECIPRPLKRDLVGHDVRHVVDMGWSSKRNGELLRLMLQGFVGAGTRARPRGHQRIPGCKTFATVRRRARAGAEARPYNTG